MLRVARDMTYSMSYFLCEGLNERNVEDQVGNSKAVADTDHSGVGASGKGGGI